MSALQLYVMSMNCTAITGHSSSVSRRWITLLLGTGRAAMLVSALFPDLVSTTSSW